MQMAAYNQRNTGIILVVVSALVFSSAGVFTKGVSTEAWGVIFWRGAAAALFTISYLALRGQLWAEVRAFKGPAAMVALIGASGSAAFIPAFKLSSVANVALIYGAAPFVAAALSWVFIRERPTGRVLAASFAGFGGVLLIFGGSWGGVSLLGDMLALWMTLMMAGVIVIYRIWPKTTAALPAAASSILLLPPALVFGAPFDAPTGEMPVLVLFGLVFAVASVTLSEGARRLPAAETALLSTLEMPFAPLLALLILSEVPATQTLWGGAIILAAVIWSQRRAAG